MLAVLTKGLRSSKPTTLPSRLPLQCRPSFAKQIVPFANKHFPKSGGGQPDSDVLQKFKKIAALRREFERHDGVELVNHNFRYVMKMGMQGEDYHTVTARGLKVYELQQEYITLMRDLSTMDSEVPKYSTYRQRLRFASELEALLEADAAQPRPVLRMQERLAVKEVSKAFLKLDKRLKIAAWISILIFGGLLGKSLHWLWKRFYRTPVDDTDFSKVHKSDSEFD
ncbi:MAG: hypothetical protein ASARMPREDX12_009142 [Alectoria sarmentosa]|nr:MAG: hypothetical protein ASARMPREDX12_009142 [Alectoria sarmentosa]